MSIQLHIATTNTCNARCGFCIYKSPENTLPKGVMSMDLYRKIIDEAATIPSITSIAFSALGEPLLDPMLPARVAYAFEKKADWEMVELYTNGTPLTPEKFEALKNAGLTHLSISLNATNQEQHERVMGLKGKFSTVVQNARYAIDHADGKVDVHIKAVFSGDEFTTEDQMRFYLTWGIKGRDDLKPGYGTAVQELNWAGGNRTLVKLDPNSWCGRATNQISILYDGRVTLCCFDPLAKHPFGDLKTQTIKEIYNSPEYVAFREMHVENRAAEHPMCAVCSRV